MNKQILLLTILSIIINVILSQSSSDYDVKPTLLAFFSNNPNNPQTLFKYNRVDLTDGSLNITLYTRSSPYGKMLGVNSFDGVNWYDYQYFFQNEFQDGGISILEQGDSFAAWLNPQDIHSGLVDFVPHPLGLDSKRTHLLSVGWSKKTQALLTLGFNSGDYNMFFYYNITQYQVEPKYENSLTQCYDNGQEIMYINYINPTNNQRQILTHQPYNSSIGMDEYSFSQGSDLTKSVNSNTYLFFTNVGSQSESPLFMVEVSNITGTPSTVNLLSINLSNDNSYSASMKLIISLDNTFGSNIDGIPFCYTSNDNQYLILLSKPTSTQSYTITTVDLINNYETSTITTDVVDFYNFGLYYQ